VLKKLDIRLMAIVLISYYGLFYVLRRFYYLILRWQFRDLISTINAKRWKDYDNGRVVSFLEWFNGADIVVFFVLITIFYAVFLLRFKTKLKELSLLLLILTMIWFIMIGISRLSHH